MAKIKFNNEKEWLSFRKGKIGGTLVSAICGKNPYKNNVDAYNIIVNASDESSTIDNEAVIKGKKAEELILKLWALDHPKYKVKHFKYEVFTFDNVETYYSSPDGIAIDTETGEIWMLEVKTAFLASASKKESWKNNLIPPNYYCQCIWEYLSNPKAKGTIIIAELLYNDGLTQRITRYVPREDTKEDAEWLLNQVDIFTNDYVKKRVPPSLKLNIDL